jgi:ElaA protein
MSIQYTIKPFYDLTLDELYDILQIRQEVFVVEQRCHYLDCDGKDRKSLHMIGRSAEGLIVTYCRLLPENVSYQGDVSIGRVLNAASVRGQGAGWQMMQLAIQKCSELWPGKDIRIGAQQYLKAFYGGLGFVQVGDPYLEDDIPHIEMVRAFQH